MPSETKRLIDEYGHERDMYPENAYEVIEARKALDAHLAKMQAVVDKVAARDPVGNDSSPGYWTCEFCGQPVEVVEDDNTLSTYEWHKLYRAQRDNFKHAIDCTWVIARDLCEGG